MDIAVPNFNSILVSAKHDRQTASVEDTLSSVYFRVVGVRNAATNFLWHDLEKQVIPILIILMVNVVKRIKFYRVYLKWLSERIRD